MIARNRARTSVWFGVVLISLGSGFGVTAATAADADNGQAGEQVTALVKAFEAANFAERQQAAEKLVEMGEAIRPALEKMLAEDGDLSSLQKARIRDVLIDDGAIVRLEKTGGLEEDQIVSLQELRAEKVKGNDRYRIGNDLTKTIGEEEMDDAALALLVYSLTRQVRTNRNDDSGLEPYALARVFEAIMAKPTAGEATGRAFGAWIRECIIPTAFPAEEGSSPEARDYQATQLVQRLIAQDKLDALTYDQLLSAMCRKMAAGASTGYGSDLGLNGQTIVPICYSRHCESKHVGLIVEAIVSEALHQDGRGGWSNGSQCIEYVIGSPRLTEGQARALLAWIISNIGGLDWMDQKYLEAAAQLSGQSFITAEDVSKLYAAYFGESTADPTKDIQARMKAWWDAHEDKPLLSAPPPPRYRYVLAEISRKDDAFDLKVVHDLPLQPGVGRMLRHEDAPNSYEYLCQMRTSSVMSSFMTARQQLLPDAVDVTEYQMYEGGSTSGAKTYLPGEPQFVSQRSTERDGTRIQVVRMAMLLPIEGSQVSAEQLQDVSFWIERAVRAAAEQVVRSTKLGRAQLAVVNESGLFRTNPLSLQPYQMPALEAEVRKLLAHAEPAVVATAALLLARWQTEFDATAVRPLLASKDDFVATTAAEALATTGDATGLEALIEQVKDPLRAGSAARVLVKAASTPKLDDAARKKWAARMIRALLPQTESPNQSLLTEMLVVKAWTGEGFGYAAGADPAANNAALKKCHDWAAAQAD